LVETLDKLAAGPIPEVPQDESLVTYAERLQRAESAIDWTRPAQQIDRQIRGLQPWPLAVGHLSGRALGLLQSAVVSPTQQAAAPGTVILASGDHFHVACGQGVVALTRVKPEGRRPMAARDFLNGGGIAAGMVMT
jgi:methionyl-tRNA formyltransferase